LGRKYKFRVVQVSGTSTVIGAKMIIARTGGVVAAWFNMAVRTWDKALRFIRHLDADHQGHRASSHHLQIL